MIRSRFEFDCEDPFHICGYHRHLGTMEDSTQSLISSYCIGGNLKQEKSSTMEILQKMYGVIKKPIEKYSKIGIMRKLPPNPHINLKHGKIGNSEV